MRWSGERSASLIYDLFHRSFKYFGPGILLILALPTCGSPPPSNPGAGHDPNLPIPVVISDSVTAVVGSSGRVISTPDQKGVLSISQNALTTNATVTIKPVSVPGAIDQAFDFSSLPDLATISTTGSINITLRYDPAKIPLFIPESDLRLGLYDRTQACWFVYFDSPPVVSSAVGLHPLSSRNITALGVFGVVNLITPTCGKTLLPP